MIPNLSPTGISREKRQHDFGTIRMVQTGIIERRIYGGNDVIHAQLCRGRLGQWAQRAAIRTSMIGSTIQIARPHEPV